VKDRVVDAGSILQVGSAGARFCSEQVKTRDPRVPCLRLQSSPSATDGVHVEMHPVLVHPPPCTTKDSLLLRHAPEQERVILLLVLGKWKVRDKHPLILGLRAMPAADTQACRLKFHSWHGACRGLANITFTLFSRR
jgi:hypothetical protein